MKRILAAILAFMMLSLPALSARPKVMDAIRPIQLINLEDPFGPRINGCTTAFINKQKRYWVTAEHCVPAFNFPQRMIDEEYFTVVMRDVIHDIAILQTRKAKASHTLNLSRSSPDFNTDILVAGWPLQFLDPMLTRGIIANPASRFVADAPRPYMVLNITGARGNSGAPIVDAKNGMLYGIVQMGWVDRNFSPMMGGTPWKVLDHYRQYWDERLDSGITAEHRE